MLSENFREETRSWLEENCPKSIRTPMPANETPGGGTRIKYRNPETKIWMDRCAARGFTAPIWPTEYGGAGLSVKESQVLREEMSRINARPALVGMGLSMIGPALLEYGTDEQKAEHLPKEDMAWQSPRGLVNGKDSPSPKRRTRGQDVHEPDVVVR